MQIAKEKEKLTDGCPNKTNKYCRNEKITSVKVSNIEVGHFISSKIRHK